MNAKGREGLEGVDRALEINAQQLARLEGQIREAEAAGDERRTLNTLRMVQTILRGEEHLLTREPHIAAVLLDKNAFIDKLMPLATVGKKFISGRKIGTIGPVRSWLRKYMNNNPDPKSAEAWEAFKKRPPKGCKVIDAGSRTSAAPISKPKVIPIQAEKRSAAW